MKKRSLMLGLLVGGAIAMTSCSEKKASEVAYSQSVTENTAPVQTDNQTEIQNQTVEVIDVEETASPAEQESALEVGSKVTEKQKASNILIMNPVVATMVPVTRPAATKCPSLPVITCGPQATKVPTATIKPQATMKPSATAAPQATNKPVVTQKPVATQTPTATKKPVATKTPSTDSSENGSSNSTYASSVLNLVNEQRKANGLSALTTTTALNNAATKRAKEIVTNFSHTRPDGTSGVTVLKEYGISYNAWGENIAYGQRTPAAVMDAWMNSSGHRANILSSKFGKVGIGCYQYNGVLYWTQVFTN